MKPTPFTDLSLLQPGDTLLYRPSNWIGCWIAMKTWTWLSHVELYVGDGCSIGARSKRVGYFSLRTDELVYVRRPVLPFNLDKALFWFDQNMLGQKYDLKGLFVFYYAAKTGSKDRAFCSETQTRVYRAGDFEPFNPDYDADRISPAQYLQAGTLRTIWSAYPSRPVQNLDKTC